ncbi:PhoX family phosphatase [Kaustia mangrovi]|uniref:PhoX family phosphatase n=1 Tax=Kaustia mangrovi TaxID=2593653 RepID=A0A7S8C7D9_9HYPH|nr:PhoX family phosphatase [Kaustia mangrovi]QPC44770.1 PhoX family phosphatase [Kaustia mangrovi]
MNDHSKRIVADDGYCNKAEAFEASDDQPANPHLDRTLGDVIGRRFARRDVLKSTLAVSAIGALFGTSALTAPTAKAAAPVSSFDFAEIDAGVDETHHVARGYDAAILLRWGDPIFADAPAFDPANQSAEAQLRQFGYNNDYVAFLPLDDTGTRGLICVNHEYTNEEVMFPGLGRQDKVDFAGMTAELVDIEMAAHGVSIVEIALENGTWTPVLTSRFNRRISPLSTEMAVDGPAAGHARLKTSADRTGKRVMGTLNNCAGGHTPWGTYLAAEENFHGYFWTDEKDAEGKRLTKGLGGDQQKSYERYAVPGGWYAWGRFHDRFNVDKEPNEPNRFGWVVEIDPNDPGSTPVKHTALGRFRHEGAETILNSDGRVVVYMGDDARFDYLYRFVSREAYREGDKAHNMALLSDGTLSVARFGEDGSMEWLPLVFGEGPLTPENGFESQADVLIDTRLAADLLGATPMDRPEDVQPNPATDRVYVMLTNNTKRKADATDAANPRGPNAFGHVVELTPPGGDHAAETFAWDILVTCGDPRVAEIGAVWNPATSDSGWFASPDNAAVDADGRLWISTDQGGSWPKTGKADGLYAVDTEGDARGLSRMFFRCPVGAEMCGPYFAPDGETLFVAVQHPATDGTKDYAPFARASTFENPATRWPDFEPGMPPRPSVLAIRKTGGGRIAKD